MKSTLSLIAVIFAAALASPHARAAQEIKVKEKAGDTAASASPVRADSKPQEQKATPAATTTPQQPAAAPKPQAPAAKRDRLEPDERASTPADVPAEIQANRREQLSEEEAAVVPYYNNFMASYRLGPEDVISIRVFGHDRYSMTGVTVPPNGRVAYWFVPEGLMVTGRTTEQVQAEVAKHLDEYIIDPQVTVTLERAMSARYSVIGDVAQPGIRVMTRRLTVYEALVEAGGVLRTGDMKKVMVVRQNPDGTLRQIPVNVSAILKGQALNNNYLAPGDQVVVPGNRLKTLERILSYGQILTFARIFAGGW